MDPKIASSIDSYTHNLKSPLAKVKALCLIIKNTKDKKIIDTKIAILDECIDLLNERFELLFEFLNVHNKDFEYNLSFFKISNLFVNLSQKYSFQTRVIKDIEILGDFLQTQKAFELILKELSQVKDLTIKQKNSTKNGVILIFEYTSALKFKTNISKSLTMPLSLASEIISLLGGYLKIIRNRNKLEVFLPLRFNGIAKSSDRLD